MGNDRTPKKEYQDTCVRMKISYGNFLLEPTTWKDHIEIPHQKKTNGKTCGDRTPMQSR